MNFMGTLGIAATLLFASAASAQTSERFVAFNNGIKVGWLKADRNGQAVDLDYYISENGRGPKGKEHIVLDAAGRPASWSIKGQSLAGGAVDENFVSEGRAARWNGLAETGRSNTAGDKIYVAAAGSPWSLALYARYLLRQPQGTAAALPSGQLRLTKRLSTKVGKGTGALPIDIYTLDGLYFSPDIIALDAAGNLFAHMDGNQMLVREDHQADAEQLKQIGADLTDRLQSELHAKLAHKITVPWRITNVRLFDPVKKALTPISTVVVFDDRIVRVEAGAITAVPKDEKLIDGGGGTLLPGLVDMHAHDSQWLGYQRLAAGVTTIRDMGNDNQRLLNMDAKRRAGNADGPRIVRAGFLEGKSKTAAAAGFTVDTLDRAMDALHWYADHGYPYLKTYNSLDPAWMKPLATEAHRLGMRTVGHVPAFTTADAMIEAGYDEVTHINQLILQYVLKPDDDPRTTVRLTAMHRFAEYDLTSAPVRHTIDMMEARGVGLDTTIAAMERLNIQRDRVTPDGDALHLDHMPLMFQRNRRRTFLAIPDAKTDREHFQARDKLVELVGLLHREGIKLWPGTDDEVAYTIHRELQLYVKAGIPAAETLAIDTHDTIVHLGLDHDLGTIAAGKLADFILVPGSPIDDITTLRNVSLVSKGGVIYFPSEIYEALNVKPFSKPPAIR